MSACEPIAWIGAQGHAALPPRLHHIGIGKAHKGKRVIMLVDDLDIRVLDEDGEVLRELVLDPSKDYQGTGGPPGAPKGRARGSRG